MNNIAIVQDDRYTSGMSAALGAYLKTMREGRNLDPKDVLPILSKRLGKKVDHSRLWRAEQGDAGRWPDGDFLTALLDVIGGDLEDIRWIQLHPDAEPVEGERRARERLNSREKEMIADLLSSDADRLHLLRAVLSLTKDPFLRGRIQGYVDSLQSETGKQ